MQDVVIVAAARTPIANFGGPFADIPIPHLASYPIREVIRRAGIDAKLVEHVAMGNVLQCSEAPNVARMAGIHAGLDPEQFTGITLNFQCGSGMEAINQCVRTIQLGEWEVAIAGGVEVMSRAPFEMYGHRWGHRMGNDQILDYFENILTTVSTDVFGVFAMSQTAENLAEQYNITRRDQDEFAALSHKKAVAAHEAGRFNAEIMPVTITQKKEAVSFDRDQRPRADSTVEKLSTLKAAFKKDGTVTAANSSGINDGSAAVLLMTAAKAASLGLKPLALIAAHATAGVHPSVMGIGPAPAIRRALPKAGLELQDISLFELNEAFSAQALACVRELQLDMDKVNVNGGAVALGHPVGCSGTRIVVTLVHELLRRGDRYGVASLCCGGGLGVATVVENAQL